MENSSTVKVWKNYNTGDITVTGESSGGVGGIAGGMTTGGEISYCAAINNKIEQRLQDGTYGNSTSRIKGSIGGATLSNNFANLDMLVNGSPVTETDSNARNGKDTPKDDFKSIDTYKNDLDWVFCDGVSFPCDADHPWKMPSSGYPILYWQ
jgi:hypothetical protein